MSNFLFQNISNVFGAPGIVKEIVEKLTPAHEDPRKRDKEALGNISDVQVDDDGEVTIPNEIVIGKTQGLFGEKFYETAVEDVAPQVDAVAAGGADKVAESVKSVVDTMKAKVKQDIVAPILGDYGVKKGTQSRIERQVDREIERKFEVLQGDFQQQANIAKAEYERRQREADTPMQVREAEADYQAGMDAAMQSLMNAVQETVKQTIQEKPQEIVEQMERHQAEQEKKTVEDSVRAHLRGFARTIPSFIMAYGDGQLTLANFDDYTEDDVFLEVTGITEDDFRFLRDGGDYVDPDTGSTEHFDGHLFDEVVFDDSIEEFWKKKLELANYFDESHEEDIFDYIPPQKTNQIFTPKWVVSKMVDELEENNPGCFDDPTKTFADLYMKSGLYITEIVKRLFRSEGLKVAYPDEGERIRHILQKQVYGMAPTRIIYLIATNYILGFDEQLKNETANFVQADAAEAAKAGTLMELVDKYFG